MEIHLVGYSPFVNTIPVLWYSKEFFDLQLKSGHFMLPPTHEVIGGRIKTMPGYLKRFSKSEVKPIKIE